MTKVALFTRAWIEIATEIADMMIAGVALFTRAWIEIKVSLPVWVSVVTSPSSRGRGLKFVL